MKTENKIKRYVEKIKNCNNIVDRAWYLKKLSECKKEIINILSYNNDFIECYYGKNIDKVNGWKMENYCKYFLNKYQIKKLYINIDNNFNTIIHNIDFDI